MRRSTALLPVRIRLFLAPTSVVVPSVYALIGVVGLHARIIRRGTLLTRHKKTFEPGPGYRHPAMPAPQAHCRGRSGTGGRSKRRILFDNYRELSRFCFLAVLREWHALHNASRLFRSYFKSGYSRKGFTWCTSVLKVTRPLRAHPMHTGFSLR
jgi:hypothetical protein